MIIPSPPDSPEGDRVDVLATLAAAHEARHFPMEYADPMMVRLDCSGVIFGSQLDERYLFEWAMQISGAVRWEQDTLVLKSLDVSQATLRDLLALFSRYQIPMKQLAQFRNPKNEGWFAAPQTYWHTQVFG
jgi:hypothetical protein